MDYKQNEINRLEHASSGELRDEIRGTRRQMDQTLDRLGERLTPRHLVEDLIGMFRSGSSGNGHGTGMSTEQMLRTGRRLGRNLSGQVREHPVPSMLIGAGLLWWMMDAMRDENEYEYRPRRTTGYGAAGYGPSLSDMARSGQEGGSFSDKAGEWGSQARDKAEDVKERMGEMGDEARARAQEMKGRMSEAAHRAGESISQARERLGDRAHQLGEAAQERWHHTQEAFQRTGRMVRHRTRHTLEISQRRTEEAIENYPLACAGMCMAAGVLIGALLPHTRREDELMGEASEEMFETIKHKGEELLEHGKGMAAETAGRALSEAEARGLTPAALAQKVRHVATEAIEAGVRAASETARQEGVAPDQLKEKVGSVAETARDTARSEAQERKDEVLKS